MKKFKRVLAMSLALVLLLSFSPMFNVSATDADEPTYNQLMHGYGLLDINSNDYSDTVYTSFTANAANVITAETDADNNPYINFTNYTTNTGSTYVTLKHAQSSNLTGKFVFETEICYVASGLTIEFYSTGSATKMIMKLANNKLTFTNGSTVTLAADRWYKITYAFDIEGRTYDAFVDGERAQEKGTLDAGITSTKTVRVSINKQSAGGEGQIKLRNVNWYLPSDGACPDANRDHICDYGCSEPVGVCGDADGDELCDYGCGKIYSPFNDLMHGYKLNNSSSSVAIAGAAQTAGYITEDENGSVKFGNFTEYGAGGFYVDMKHGLTNATKFVFEAEFYCNAPGFLLYMRANKNSNGGYPDIMKLDGNKLTFMGTNGATVTLGEGEWYKVTMAFDLEKNKYDAFVNGKRVVDDGVTTNAITSLSRLRVQIDGKTVAGGEFLIKDINWYSFDETGACPDYDKDHICDYGCSEPVGECGDGDGDNKCDYCGDCVYHTYIIAGDEVHCENCDVAGNVITESGVLDLKGQSVKDGIKVTGEKTILSVVDTSWMTNGLDGKNVGKLIVTEGAEKIETYTQYGDFKYLKVPSEDGTYFTFHPFNLTITRMGLNTAKQETCLEVQFVADNVVRDLLIGENEDHNYGLKNLLTGNEGSVKGVSKYQFTTQSNRAVAYFSLSGSLHNDNIDKEVQFQAYMKLKVGGEEIVILSNYIAKITPRQIMIDLNNSNVEPADEQQLAKIRAIWTNEDGTDNVDYSELKSILTRFN